MNGSFVISPKTTVSLFTLQEAAAYVPSDIGPSSPPPPKPMTNDEIMTKFSTLTSQVTQLTNQVSSLTAANTQLSDQVSLLTAANTQLSAANTQLSDQVSSLAAANTQLSDQVSSLTAANTQLSDQVSSLTADKTEMKGQLDRLATNYVQLVSVVQTCSSALRTVGTQLNQNALSMDLMLVNLQGTNDTTLPLADD